MRYFLICMLVLLQGCLHHSPPPDYITLLDKTTLQFNQDVNQEYQLQCSGYGGSLMDDVSMVVLHYNSIQNHSIVSSRQLIVACMEKLKNKINADAKLRPFLHEYPFPSNRLELSIGFINKNGDFFADDSVAYVHTCNGKIFYSKYEPVKDRLENIWKEDYAEALRIVCSETSSMPNEEFQAASASYPKSN